MHALSRRRWLAACAAVLPAASAARSVAAAPFPQRPVRIVVPYSVGVGPDVVARAVAEQLTTAWNQPVLVDNKPGAAGIVAFGDVRRTAPDGHTLYLADTATLAVNPLLHTSLPYDPVRDLEPLTLLFRATFLLWVGARNRFTTLAALMAGARRAPGQVSYATLGNGHASHIAVETFARAAGLHMLHVPFKDAGALMTSVVAGDVDFTTFSMNTVAGLYAGGRLRPLAVAAAQRLAVHPEIPTLAQAGGPAVEMHPWAGLVTVAGTPAPLLERLQADLATALASTRVRSQAELAGFEITPSSPQALRARMDADAALVRPLLDEGRIARV
ncbi:Bug family tripartite tricarboxylate transporter substrate binding protein [Rubrivivax sp. RP6-9]|uniref:Bug family tripartite tricarboxylate transporter substrate binding protein n=1 Tax=Rubrivivax sp. RP6-9 TaxID=3415750 RepID=UPI003CC5B9A6